MMNNFQYQNFMPQNDMFLPDMLQFMSFVNSEISDSFYISSIPESISDDQLLGYFQYYGVVTDISVPKFLDGRNRGNGKISIILNPPRFCNNMDKPSIIKAFLKIPHKILGTRITLQEFLDDQRKLNQTEEDVVQRRICVLSVPHRFTDEMLKAVFEYFFGEVFNGYVRKGKQKLQSNNSKLHGGKKYTVGHGFITFNTKSVREKAVKVGRLILNKNDWDETGFVGKEKAHFYGLKNNNKYDRLRLLKKKNWFEIKIKRFIAKNKKLQKEDEDESDQDGKDQASSEEDLEYEKKAKVSTTNLDLKEHTEESGNQESKNTVKFISSTDSKKVSSRESNNSGSDCSSVLPPKRTTTRPIITDPKLMPNLDFTKNTLKFEVNKLIMAKARRVVNNHKIVTNLRMNRSPANFSTAFGIRAACNFDFPAQGKFGMPWNMAFGAMPMFGMKPTGSSFNPLTEIAQTSLRLGKKQDSHTEIEIEN